MANPIEVLGEGPTAVVFAVASFFSGALMVWLQNIGRSLETEAAPRGIISFELTWTRARCEKLLDSWNEDQRGVAWKSVLLDFGFIPAYSTSLAISCGLAAAAVESPLAATGLIWLAYGQWLAATMDVIENLCLLRILRDGSAQNSWLPLTASVAATLKFALILAGGLSSIFVGLAWLRG